MKKSLKILISLTNPSLSIAINDIGQEIFSNLIFFRLSQTQENSLNNFFDEHRPFWPIFLLFYDFTSTMV
jgi:hypothetical protein